MTLKNSCAAALMATLVAGWAHAQSAIERHTWQDKRAFRPYSRTAEAITGTIRLSGNSEFATPGSRMTITFANGKAVRLTSVGASWRQWDDTSSGNTTAEVFKMDRDPGKLGNGNTLCGDPKKSPARFIAFTEASSSGPSLLGVAVFSSNKAPRDINSDGLCGTFNYVVE